MFGSKSTDPEIHKCSIKQDDSKSFLPKLPKQEYLYKKLWRRWRKNILIWERSPQCTEYYRSKAEILRIRRDHVASGSLIIHPFSKFRAHYEVWMTLVLYVTLIYFPMDAAFDLYPHSGVRKDALEKHFDFHPHGFRPIPTILRLFLILDILLTFVTGYPVKKRRKVVMRPIKIVKNYVFSIYFISDLLSAIPEPFFSRSHNNQRIISAFGFFKIVRLPTLFYYTSRGAELFHIKTTTVQYVNYSLATFIVFHWVACCQFMVPQIRYFLNGEFLAESWIIKWDVPEMRTSLRYLVSFYRASGLIFCVIFEDLHLEVWEEKVFAIIIFIFGKVFIFYITVFILHVLLSLKSLEIKYFETLSQVQAYMTRKHLPMHMQTRLLQFYDYKYNKKFFKERSITGLLSEKLRSEINLSVCSKLVQSVTILSHLPPQQLEHVVTYLKPEIYLPNDIIIKAGSLGECMYFLASGTVAVWTPSGKEVCHLQDGAYFGEITLLFKDKRRTANIVAIETCEVYKLDRKAFRQCFKTNAQLLKTLEDVANERLEVTQMFEDVHAKTFMEIS